MCLLFSYAQAHAEEICRRGGARVGKKGIHLLDYIVWIGDTILKITFSEQAIREAERRQADRSRAQHHESATAMGQTAFVDMFGRQQDGILANGGEKGKSLIELQQEAGNIDVAVQRDYMTVMSHTLSEEDYARLQEEGFDLGSMEPEEAVNIVDKIKAELVRAGKNIVGYTDDMSIDRKSVV